MSRRWRACARSSSAGCALPGDETGDCFLFTRKLAAMAAALGAEFRYGLRISRLAASGGRIDGVATPPGAVVADAYVLALGSYSPLLARPLGLSLPVLPGQGLLDHGADHRQRGSAGVDGDGRDAQGRGERAGRPHPRSAARPNWPATASCCARRGAPPSSNVVTDLFRPAATSRAPSSGPGCGR